MAGEYLSQLIQLEEALNESSGAFSDAISEQLAQTVNDMKGQQISVEEYLRVMQLFFRKYEREHNRDGQHYCAIRMLQLQHALKKKRRHYALVEGDRIPEQYAAYIYDKSQFYRQTFTLLQQRLLLLTLILFVILFLLLHFLLSQTNSVALVEAVIISLLIFLYSFIRMPKLYMLSQLEAAGRNVENVLLEFDYPIVSGH